MESLDEVLKEVSELPGVIATAVADDIGTFISGVNVDDADEFAAILTYIGRSGIALEDLLGAEHLHHITLSGKDIKLVVHQVNDLFLGVRLEDGAVLSKVESKIGQSIKKLAS